MRCGKLTFAVSAYTEKLDDTEEEEEDRDPNTDIYLFPEGNRDTSSRDIKGQNGKPSYCVIPAHGEAPAKACYYSIFLGYNIVGPYQASSINLHP